MGRCDDMRIEEEKEENKYCFWGDGRSDWRNFLGKMNDAAVALLDEKGGFVYGTTWHWAAAVDGLILGMTMTDSFIYV